jgi:hypothetical protein
MRSVDDGMDQFVHGCMDTEQVHTRGRHHHIARRHVSHANHALQHDAGLSNNDVVVLGFGQRRYEFSGRVGAGMDELGQFAQEGTLIFFVGRSRRMWV